MIKDILVYLDGSKEDEVRLSYAVPIAEQHEAVLTGLLCVEIPDVISAGDGVFSVGKVAAELQAQADEYGDKAESALKEAFSKLDVRCELRRIDTVGAQMGAAIADEARVADVFVATRPYGHFSEQPELMEKILFSSGRACLFVPPAIPAKEPLSDIVVGWRNSRETARAVADAIPFLQKAKKVTLAMVHEADSNEELRIESGADMARHLDRHGVNVELRNISGWDNAGEALLNEIERTDANMFVIGGYGHSRFREWVLGGVTRDVLTKAEVPVLIAH
ncbi:universal stress protein [Maritalea porphyrae]|uniref:universal stress protein n=1 Tax=Maritalea porphyrae TaxID=880732 RepID=UPI0022AE9895|nr:universal stress protein [Maritalea porphyrae]MCZ4272627.1 universal stress protein [Maritalea porphyrae]